MRRVRFLAVVAASLSFVAISAASSETLPTIVKVGEVAHPIRLVSSTGDVYDLDSRKSHTVVLVFFRGMW